MIVIIIPGLIIHILQETRRCKREREEKLYWVKQLFWGLTTKGMQQFMGTQKYNYLKTCENLVTLLGAFIHG